jgi:hypothetical protein
MVALACALATTGARAQNFCDGDCDADGEIGVDEVILCVNVALGLDPLETCTTCDADGSGAVTIADVVAAVGDLLDGCESTPPGTACNYIPTTCTELMPGMPVPAVLDRCYKITRAGTYVGDTVNIVKNRQARTDGALYILEAPGETIDLRVRSLLVEQGGVLQAGAVDCPIGRLGGRFSIGLYGDDPSRQATMPNPPPGITCRNAPPTSAQPCFPSNRDFVPNRYYCTVANSDDPCSSVTVPTAPCAGFENARNASGQVPTCPKNSLLEGYHPLNFDPTPFGYKVLGVSYGGSLRLFGYKGAKPLQDGAWRRENDSDQSCVVPSAAQSTLDRDEMEAWAALSGSSWVRLDEINPDRTQITLDRVVGDWEAGDQLVVGTTDWHPSHSERRTIRSVATASTPGGMRTRLTLCRPTEGGTGPGGCAASAAAGDALDYPHNAAMFDTDSLGGTFTIEPLNRSAADLRAAVGLLSRSIRVYSLGADADSEFPPVADCTPDKTKAECYFGGHTMIRQGFREAQIQGVEFKQLGQGGRIGHYPVHFHLAKSTAYAQGRAYVKDSSVWDSMTRFVAMHGTHRATVARNVGYLSVGNGYYIEDGSEIENKFCHNLGVGARAALQEYFAAQARLSPLPLTARLVPPILDGSANVPVQDTSGPNRPNLLTGSDAYMPVMFWMMNAYNELVGNQAVGVHGFGSCYWLLASGLSGPSFTTHQFDGLAKYNVAGDIHAPLLRFRGNSCTTAPLALPASADLPPAPQVDTPENQVGYHAVPNPYIAGKSLAQIQHDYARPAVTGNFQPIVPNSAGPNFSLVTNCAPTGLTDAGLAPNVHTCATTVIDRFTTSYNWAEVNFGSIWFRPWFYLFLNGAVTDQLFGGLTFVSSGSWMQVPPGYFTLAKNNLFVGTSQHDASTNRYARRSGPALEFGADSDVGHFAPCAGPKVTCNLPADGTGYWRDFLQPKRLITIYDGPHFADGNAFVNVGSWECDPQPCAGLTKERCVEALQASGGAFPCGIYSSTQQPAIETGSTVDSKKMVVIDAAVGWKQPNGFYYPPAFTYRRSSFLKSVPTALQELNQCFSYGPADDYVDPTTRPGSCRHNVIDRTRPYIKGSLISPNGDPQIFGPPPHTPLPVTPIDFSTILVDLDGSLTGATGMLAGGSASVPTDSVSRNPFFDAPAQSPECLSYGVQTSPYQFVSTMMAPLAASPASGDTAVKPWTTFNCMNGYDDAACQCLGPREAVISAPLVPIYRQWRFPGEPTDCGPVCSATHPGQYGCGRGTYMTGPNVGHATYLTMTEPPGGLPMQAGALYYIDTAAGDTPAGAPRPDISCVTARTCSMRPPTFTGGESYVVYNLFARNDARVSYQLYVGATDLAAIQGRYVRVTPHVYADAENAFSSKVTTPCDPMDPTPPNDWCKDLPMPHVDSNGVLTVILDQRGIAPAFRVDERADYEVCLPRDFCYRDGSQCKPCTRTTTECIAQTQRLQEDLDALSHPDGTMSNPLDVICNDWASFASGTEGEAPGELSLVDCPAGGCLGFAFTLPTGFSPRPYNDVGAAQSHCFLESDWIGDELVARMEDGMLADPLCGEPRHAMPSDFCTDAMP